MDEALAVTAYIPACLRTGLESMFETVNFVTGREAKFRRLNNKLSALGAFAEPFTAMPAGSEYLLQAIKFRYVFYLPCLNHVKSSPRLLSSS